jgi:hypothetical protein
MANINTYTEKETIVAADLVVGVNSEATDPDSSDATVTFAQDTISEKIQADFMASDYKSTDGTMADNSDDVVPTEKAVKTYADTKMALNPTTIEMAGCSANSSGSVAEGFQTTASGYYAHSEGYITTASDYATHSEGYHTTASGYTAHSEGYQTTASGDGAHSEGWGTTASGFASHAGGAYSKTRLEAQFARAGGKFAETSDAQYTQYYLRLATTDATETEMILPARFVLPQGGIFYCNVSIHGTDATGAVYFSGTRQVVIKNIAGTTSLNGEAQTVGTDITSGDTGGISITADDTNDSLCINVTGKADTTMRWHVVIDTNEIGFY